MDPSSRSTEAKLRRRTSQQRLLADLSSRSVDCEDLDDLLAHAADVVTEALDVDSCKILELLPGDDRFLLRAGNGWDGGLVGETTVPADRGSQAGYTLLADDPVVVADLRTEDRFDGPDLLFDHDLASGVSAVIGPNDDPWGVLGAHATTKREFDEVDTAFVETVANVLASAVDRERAIQRRETATTLTDTIVETSPVGITLVDADGANVFANDRAEELLGRPLEELRTYVHDDDRWNLVDEDGTPMSGEEVPFSIAEERGEPVYGEIVGIDHPDGQRVWLSTHCAPLFDADGAFDGAVYIIEDVTERKRLESELEMTLDRVTDAFHAFDADWNFTYANEQARELLGVEDRDLVGRNVWETFPSATDSTFEREYRRAMEAQERVTFEEYSPVADAWLEITAYPSESGLSVYFRDVTDRREMEAELRESEEQFRTLAEHLEEVVWLTGEDPTDLIYINPAYEAVYGLDRDRLYEAPLSFLEVVHPDDRERVRQAYAGLPENEYDEEFRIVDSNGQRRWIHARAVPVSDDEGAVTRIVGIDTDVTDRKERERYLHDAKTQLEAATEAGAIGTWEWHIPEDRFVAGPSMARKFGVDPDAAREGVPREIFVSAIHEADYDRVMAEVEEAMKCCGEYESEYRVRNADGDLRWVTARGHVVCDEDGTPRRFPGALIDITDRKEFQRKLTESNERLEQFAYAASHDLQEPLRMVSSYLRLLEGRYAEELDSDAREFIEFAVDGADRMREMIDGLLEFSRVETQGGPLEPVDLNDVFEDARRDLRVRIEESDAEITADELPRVRGDGNQLRQVFQNLLDNAIEYSDDEPPRVHVSAERSATARDGGDRWRVSVSDEGIGIDPDDQERIFGVFKRLHTREEHAGSGIGLALCQRIVERHGGEIRVDSEPGEGTTISVTLPSADAGDR